MTKGRGQPSEFLAAAQAVETDMSCLEALAQAARRVNLNTEKNIARAARGLQEAMAQQERLGEKLRQFGESMLQMQSRQQSAVTSLSEQALEVQRRMASFSEHMQRFQALGARANEVAQALRDVAAETAGDSNGAARGRLGLQEVDARFRQLLEELKALADSARAQNFPDVASETSALQQRLHALSPRLAEVLRAHGATTNGSAGGAEIPMN